MAGIDIGVATLIGVFDRAGIIAFAVSGVEVGVRRRFDVFGLLVMGLVTATGGGLLRDIVMGRLPLILTREDYVALALGASLVAIPLVTRAWVPLRLLLTFADAVGLGAFAVAGALAAVQMELSLPATVLLAILTATGGGVIRDLLADRVPLVLTSEINATAAAFGGMTVWFLEPESAGLGALSGALLVAGLRVVGVALGINLPAPGGREGEGGG